jgi:hypothetical protein
MDPRKAVSAKAGSAPSVPVPGGSDLKFSAENGINLEHRGAFRRFQDRYFSVVISVFSGIMSPSKIMHSGGYGHRFKDQILVLLEGGH